MIRILLFIGVFFASVSFSFSQRVLLDFEPEGKTAQFTAFGADAYPNPQFYISTNIEPSGINTSDSIAIYVEPEQGEPWQGMFYKPADTGEPLIDFTAGFTELCIKVNLAELGGGTVTLKAENNTNNIVHESPPIPVNEGQTWVEVCYDFVGTPVDGQMIETFVIFFNITSVPDDNLQHWFDDLVQTGVPTSVNYIEASAFKVYPNPVSDVLYFETDFAVDQIIISDIYGKVLSKFNAPELNRVSMDGLQSGVYTVSFVDQKGNIGTTKAVKL